MGDGYRFAASEASVAGLTQYADAFTDLLQAADDQHLDHDGDDGMLMHNSNSHGTSSSSSSLALTGGGGASGGGFSGGSRDLEPGGRVSVSQLKASLEQVSRDPSRANEPLSGQERACASLLLFDAFAPELNLDDSTVLLLTIARRLLDVDQVRRR